jgi:PKD repeat protein
LASLLAASGPARAQFREPMALSDGAAAPPAWALGLDHFSNTVVAVVESGRLVLHTLSGESHTTHPIHSPGAEAADPDLAFPPLATYLAFTDRDPAESSRGSEVYLVRKLGNLISPAEAFSATVGDDRFPRIAVDGRGQPVIAWARELDGGGAEVIVRQAGRAPAFLGGGDRPRLQVDAAGTLHVIYVDAQSRLVYRRLIEGGGGLEPSPALPIGDGPLAADASYELRLCGGVEPLIALSRPGGLDLVGVRGGEVLPPRRLLAEPGVAAASFHCNSSGLLGLTWEQAGALWYQVGSQALLLPRERAVESPSAAAPRLAIDPYLNVYLSYLDGGRLYVTHNVRAPEAGFLAEPSEGEAPLRVRFTDRTRGNVFRWHWDFGDGGISGEQHPEHVYETPGLYSVKLAVEGAGGTNAFVGEKEIRVIDPRNRMSLGSRRAFPGQKDLYVPLTIKHAQAIQGCQIAFRFDPAVLELARVEIDRNSNFAEVAPELIVHNVLADGAGWMVVTVAVIIDFDVPHDGRTFRPGNGQRLGNLVFNVLPSTAFGVVTDVVLANQLGDPPINNIFVIGSRSVVPQLDSATVSIEEPAFPPPRFFLRGDADDSGKVIINDAIVLLNYLFQGSSSIRCLDAADADDNGQVNITDAIVVLNYLFLGGNYLAAPFPDLGLDPSPDGFDDCRR